MVSRYLDRHSFVILLRDFSHILPIACLFHFSPVLISWLQFPAHPAISLTTQPSHNVNTTHTVYGLPHGACTISDVNPAPQRPHTSTNPVRGGHYFLQLHCLTLFYCAHSQCLVSFPEPLLVLQPVVQSLQTPTNTTRKRHIFERLKIWL